MIKIMLVFGTRPEAIKMAPLIKEFQKYPNSYQTTVCVTAQHREMLDQVLKLFDISPDFDLNIMKKDQDLYDITSKVLLGMKNIFQKEKPDIVLVHGDTTTSMTTALAAFYEKIPIGHIEAGLRTFNRYSPWPEEINRQITGRLTSFHFAPTEMSKRNLLSEGVLEKNIFVTGNTVIDALFLVVDKLKNSKIEKQIRKQLENQNILENLCDSWIDNKRKLILITGHRRENFGQGFLNICEAILELSKKYPNVDFVYPMHLNPNVRKPIQEVFGNIINQNSDKNSNSLFNQESNVYFIEPLDYLPFVFLMNLSYIVLTDSGGIQEEAPGLGKPVLVMRDTTERPEAINAGTVKLVGTNKTIIVEEVSKLLNNQHEYITMSTAHNPYGDGNASKQIADILSSKISFNAKMA